MRRASLVAIVVLAGCGGGASPEPSDAPDLAVAASAEDLALGDPTACTSTIDAFCAASHCLRDMAEVEATRDQCGQLEQVVSVTSCGARSYVSEITIGTARIYVFDASGALLAVFDTSTGTPYCVAGPAHFVDPDLTSCPTDAGFDAPCPSRGCSRPFGKCA